jgi:hypothetical protein
MSDSTGRAEIIAQICTALSAGDGERARSIATSQYAFDPAIKTSRNYTPYQSLQIFMRDGFVDRYSGVRLVFPGTLRLLSHLLPVEFPAHRNWKMAESHFVFWELFPTIDHVRPAARGGLDVPENWVCTSMVRNSAKANWSLEELGWELYPPGDINAWDGLTGWFVDATKQEPQWLMSAYLRKWHSAAVRLATARSDAGHAI